MITLEPGTILDWQQDLWINPDGSLSDTVLPTVYNSTIRVTCDGEDVTPLRITRVETGPAGCIEYLVKEKDGGYVLDEQGNIWRGHQRGNVAFEYKVHEMPKGVCSEVSVQPDLP